MENESRVDISSYALQGFRIPSCPALLTKIMQKIRRPDVELSKIAALIQQDAGVVAPLLKMANSPYVGLSNKITSVQESLSILGLKTTIHLLQQVALMQSIADEQHKYEKFWERSALTARIAARITRWIPGISPDDAYVTVLFHDCGIPVLMQRFPGYRNALIQNCKNGSSICEVENEHFSTTHAVVGSLLAHNWNLPEYVCQSILHHHDSTIFQSPGERVSMLSRSLIGVIHIAEHIADEHLLQPNPEWAEFQSDVLHFFELSANSFDELKDDALTLLA